MSFIKIQPKRGGNIPKDDLKPMVVISSQQNSHKRPTCAYAHVIHINKALAERLRWVAGDRVDIEVDMVDMLVRVSRHPDGAYTLSAPGMAAAKAKGKTRRVKVAFTFGSLNRAGQPTKANWIDSDGAIIIDWIKTGEPCSK